MEVAVTRRAEVLCIAMASLAGALLCPAAAAAATQCKADPVTAAGAVTEDEAEAMWSNQVKQSLGAAWSDIKLAKDEKVSEQNLALANLFIVTAYPCRTTFVNPAILTRPSPALQQRH
jgi:hypothetical protein